MKKYLIKSVWIVVLTVLTCLAFAFLVAYKFYMAALVMLLAIVGETYYLLRHMEKGSDTLKQFIWSLSYMDFLSTYTFKEGQKDISPELATAVDTALESYKQELLKKESQLQYFRALADHIDLAILVYTPDGKVEWINQAAKYQTGIRSPQVLDDFTTYHPQLPAKLRALRPGDSSILQVVRGQETYQMILSGISFVVMGKSLTVVSMKNIRSVLEDRETEAWQKLIRVLTHEIMNSMTPIVSLSELLNGKFTPDETLSPEDLEELNHAVATIGKRSKGLIQFVENYRKVTGIPAPVMQIIPVNDLLNDIARLMKRDEVEIITQLPTAHLQIVADRGQIEQVLINLIKNACEATRETDLPRIELSAGINADGRTFIAVQDNGTGIAPQAMDRVFIPFFTTKPTGSGIGLSISRQIMHIHRGGLTAMSTEGEGSRFVLTFR
ncbi:ATP-binding protein [Bacteroides sp. OttesenSCG-928-J23]|nr:ATP-binding protein [Bacteroides sp. OttesenSCG-928-J23]MDL2299660.1 ATP-binding protein [Bacteroides sp. OttesenSCG-928-E20]